MRRGSVFNNKKLSSNKINTIPSEIPTVLSRRLSSINSGLIKRTGAFTLQELISSMSHSNKENSKLINRNRLASSRIRKYKIDNIAESDENKNIDDKEKKLLYYRKLIYKRTILDKYLNIYLNLNSNNKNQQQSNNKKIKEEYKPRIFHLYLINNILQKKRCTIFMRYEEMLKSIEGKDFLISYYGYKKIRNMLIYLLGCIYNNDEFTYNKFNDERNIYENIILNYQNIIENMRNSYEEYRASSYSFAFNEFIKKNKSKEKKYYICNKYYKFLFIQEIPSYFIPNCIPNYLTFENKIKKMIKSFLIKYKFRKIKTKYNIYLENKTHINSSNEIKKNKDKVIEEDDEEGNSEDNLELVKPHVNYYYNRYIFERSKRSFVYSKENNNKDGSFISQDNNDKLSSLMDSNLKKDVNDNYIFTKGNFLDNFDDQKLRNDNDIIEIEKMLENLGIKNNKRDKSEKNKKYENIIHSRNSSNLSIYKFFIADEEIKRNKKKLFTSKPKIFDFDIQKNKLKNTLPSIAKSNKESNKETKTLNNDNSLKNNNINLKLSPSCGKKKNYSFNKERRNNDKCYDFKRKIFKLISSRNYSSYNKKYDYNPKSKINDKLLKEKEKKQINKFLDKNNKFKSTLEFVYKSKENKKKFNKNNKLLCNLIVETQYNQKYSLKNGNNNLNEGKTKKYLTDNIVKIDNGEPGYNLFKIKYIFDQLAKKRNSENLLRQYHLSNAKTYRDVLKSGDIYF